MVDEKINGDPVVAAYYFPNYHVDPRNEGWHGDRWTEWEVLRHATPRFPGHWQPRLPLNGFEDEADPAVMARKIELATTHSVDAFLFDWYWYGGQPYLERALEHAFMPNTLAGEMQFAVMWANHDWTNIHPWKRATDATCLETGVVDQKQFEAATDYIIERYLGHPAYLRLEGRPYLSIYSLAVLLQGAGGAEGARAALEDLRVRAARAGHPDIHLNATVRDKPVLPQDGVAEDEADLVTRLGLDSVTSYVWAHHHPLPELSTQYSAISAQATRGWAELASRFDVPYLPNVTVGWDPSPRTVQSDRYDPSLGYPHTNILVDGTPEEFGHALREAQRFAASSGAPVITINAWNEWTEGSYLEPDTVYGTGHLEQIRQVFGTRRRSLIPSGS